MAETDRDVVESDPQDEDEESEDSSEMNARLPQDFGDFLNVIGAWGRSRALPNVSVPSPQGPEIPENPDDWDLLGNKPMSSGEELEKALDYELKLKKYNEFWDQNKKNHSKEVVRKIRREKDRENLKAAKKLEEQIRDERQKKAEEAKKAKKEKKEQKEREDLEREQRKQTELIRIAEEQKIREEEKKAKEADRDRTRRQDTIDRIADDERKRRELRGNEELGLIRSRMQRVRNAHDIRAANVRPEEDGLRRGRGEAKGVKRTIEKRKQQQGPKRNNKSKKCASKCPFCLLPRKLNSPYNVMDHIPNGCKALTTEDENLIVPTRLFFLKKGRHKFGISKDNLMMYANDKCIGMELKQEIHSRNRNPHQQKEFLHENFIPVFKGSDELIYDTYPMAYFESTKEAPIKDGVIPIQHFRGLTERFYYNEKVLDMWAMQAAIWHVKAEEILSNLDDCGELGNYSDVFIKEDEIMDTVVINCDTEYGFTGYSLTELKDSENVDAVAMMDFAAQEYDTPEQRSKYEKKMIDAMVRALCERKKNERVVWVRNSGIKVAASEMVKTAKAYFKDYVTEVKKDYPDEYISNLLHFVPIIVWDEELFNRAYAEDKATIVRIERVLDSMPDYEKMRILQEITINFDEWTPDEKKRALQEAEMEIKKKAESEEVLEAYPIFKKACPYNYSESYRNFVLFNYDGWKVGFNPFCYMHNKYMRDKTEPIPNDKLEMYREERYGFSYEELSDD